MGRRVKQAMWVWLGLLGWLAFLATLGLLVWLVRPGPPARPVPADQQDSEDRKASLDLRDYPALQVKQEQWAKADRPVFPEYQGPWVNPVHPVRSTRTSSVHLDSQGDLSC